MEHQLSFGEWLGDILDERGMLPSELARRIGTNPSTISGWLSDRSLPTTRNCDEIASILGIPSNDVRSRAGRALLGERDHTRGFREAPLRRYAVESNDQPGMRSVVFVPVIGVAPADASRWMSVSSHDYPIDPDDLAGIRTSAIVIAADGSMQGRGIQKGDRLLIDRDASPTAGDIVVISIGDEITLREWWPEDDHHVILRATVPSHPPRRIDLDTEHLTLIGVVHAFTQGWKIP